MENRKGRIIAISAPSGSGKTSIVRKVLKDIPELVFSVSATTRKRRKDEKEGVDYYFITENEFKKKIDNNEFIEWEKFYDYYYGTYKKVVDNAVSDGKTIILEVDVRGAISLKKIYPDAVLIYIVPPSYDELVKRLVNRKTEDLAELRKRLDRHKMELELKDKFDYFVDNTELEKAVTETESLIRKLIIKENNK